jgi:hypothetical protein
MIKERTGSTSPQSHFFTGDRPREFIPAASVSILVTALLGMAGCASGSAGQSSAESSTRDDQQPDRPASGPPDAGQTEEQTEVDESGEEASACSVETFQLHFFDDSTRIAQTVDCQQREVVEVRRSSFDQKHREAAEKAGLPRHTWYLLVDPKGLRSTFLSDEQIVQLSKEYDFRFLGRETERGLLIYEYRGDL